MRISKRMGLTAAVIGKDGRTSAIIASLEASDRIKKPVRVLSQGKGASSDEVKNEALENARTWQPDFVVIGPEEPLASGIVDDLEAAGFPCIGPRKILAQLESSKAFTRELVREFKILGNPEYRVFSSLDGIHEYLRFLKDFVIKPDGLTGGKGVKVSGVHFDGIDGGMAYCRELFNDGQELIVIEEKLDGEEFSLQSFCDGTHVVDTVVVQDHKRAHEGDTGPNTGGMGTYTDANHLLPFLDAASLAQASSINALVAKALHQKTGQKYKGILFGGFMLTRNGVRLLEYNARFGDPESLNVLSLLETDFADICVAIVNETLEPSLVRFRHQATVCKYVVPIGYPDHPVRGERIDLSEVPAESANLRVFHAAVDKQGDDLVLTGSRAVAFVGIGANLPEAYRHAENAALAVHGPVFHRIDIGSAALIQQRVDHIDRVQHRMAV